MNAGDIVEAKLSPIKTDDLRPEAVAITGHTFHWTAARLIEDEDGVGYTGQWRMELGREDHNRTGIWWAPECDLSDCVKVGVDTDIAKLHDLLRRR